MGQTQAQAIFELLGRKGELTPAQNLLCARYAGGLTAYRAQRWEDARSAFASALEAVPGDGPAATLLKRIDYLQHRPPEGDWDGAWQFEAK